jgi:hypothetical protein
MLLKPQEKIVQQGGLEMRAQCPDEEILAGYLAGRLDRAVRDLFEHHLTECDRCLDEFAVVRGLVHSGGLAHLKPVPPETTRKTALMIAGAPTDLILDLTGKARRSLKHILSAAADRLAPGLFGGRLAPVRGERRTFPDHVQLHKTFKEFEAEIDIEKTGEGKVQIRVLIPGGKAGAATRITLVRNEREVASFAVNGEPVLFEDIAYGGYVLNFSRQGETIGSYPFSIRESDNGSEHRG